MPPVVAAKTSDQAPGYATPFSVLPPYLLRSYQFGDTAGQTRVEVHMGMVKDILQFVKISDSEHRSSYEVNLAVFEVNSVCAASRTWQRELRTSTFEATNDRSRLHQDHAVIQLAPGDYRLHFEIVDRHTQRRLRRQYPLAVQDLQNGNLQISSLMLGEVSRDSTGARQLSSINLPGLLKPGALEQFLYHEIYGAAVGDSVLIDYTITSWQGDTLTAWHKTVIADGKIIKTAESLTDKVHSTGSQNLHVRVKTSVHSTVAKMAFKVQATIPERAQGITPADVLYYAALEYVSSARDFQMIAAAAGARDSLVAAFWQQRDPTPGSTRNELQEEFYRRVAQANAGFTVEVANQSGWRTDRGRIYIIHGAPREVQLRMSEEDALLYEIWFYPELGRRFIFRERENSGQFELINR